jgi:beta-xylosidase
MPGDGGFVAGAQVGAFAGRRDTFVNLFFRYARGLAAYGDRENALGVGVNASGRVTVWQREKNNTRQIGQTELNKADLVYLRMRVRNGAEYSFDVSSNGRDWKTAGENVKGEHLPPWDRGVRVALTSGGASTAAAKFNWFRIHSESEKNLARANSNGK